MIMKDFSVGIDVEDIDRFEKWAKSRNAARLQRVYTEAELDYCFRKKRPAQHLAARFCAKEAVVKALSALGLKTHYGKIEVVKNSRGVPQIRFLNSRIEKEIDVCISLTHSKNQALAFAIAGRKVPRRSAT